MKKFLNILNKLSSDENKIILVVVITGLFLRFVQLKYRFLYGHDQDLASWFVKDILVNHHFRLIGQETSTMGIFIGPFFYYLMTLFYMIFKMDPIGGAYLIFCISIFGIWSVYFVIKRIWDKTTAIFALIIYCFSYYTIFNDREVVPTMPVIIWTVWFLYAVHLFLIKKLRPGFLLAGILAGLIWHLNFALILPFPILLIALFLTKQRPKIVHFLIFVIGIGTTGFPLMLFELRHNFSQTKALIASLTTTQSDVISGIAKYERVFYIMAKNLHGLIIGSFPGIKPEYVMYFFLLVFLLLGIRKIISFNWWVIFTLWILLYFVFFSSYSKIVSEYYVNGSLIVFLVVVSIALKTIFESVRFRHVSVILVCLFAVFSIRNFVIIPINRSGYQERKEIITEIKRDADVNGYSCVSLSFITDPGYNLGYRYFTYLAGLKTKPVSEFVPVYTIVFPLKPIFPTDNTRGAIGLIYPDYEKYNLDIVNEKCDGENYNLSEPMWGFPQ